MGLESTRDDTMYARSQNSRSENMRGLGEEQSASVGAWFLLALIERFAQLGLLVSLLFTLVPLLALLVQLAFFFLHVFELFTMWSTCEAPTIPAYLVFGVHG